MCTCTCKVAIVVDCSATLQFLATLCACRLQQQSKPPVPKVATFFLAILLYWSVTTNKESCHLGGQLPVRLPDHHLLHLEPVCLHWANRDTSHAASAWTPRVLLCKWTHVWVCGSCCICILCVCIAMHMCTIMCHRGLGLLCNLHIGLRNSCVAQPQSWEYLRWRGLIRNVFLETSTVCMQQPLGM